MKKLVRQRCLWLGLSFLLLWSLPAGAMTIGTHIGVGAGLGYNFTKSAPQAFGLGLASHAVLDMVPHNDHSRWVALTTLAAGLWVTKEAYARSGQDARVLWGAVGGVIPDLEHVFTRIGWMRRGQKLFPTHTGVIKHGRKVEPKVALTLELSALGASLILSF